MLFVTVFRRTYAIFTYVSKKKNSTSTHICTYILTTCVSLHVYAQQYVNKQSLATSSRMILSRIPGNCRLQLPGGRGGEGRGYLC